MSKITEAVNVILLRTYVPEMEKLQPSEQVEATTQIIRYMANHMNRLYMDGIINAKREVSAELEEERRDHANCRHNRSENLRNLKRVEAELLKLRSEYEAIREELHKFGEKS